MYKNSVRTSQGTHYVSAAKTNRFTETIAVCLQNAKFLYVEIGGAYGKHWALKV
jgi:hypothetical protein